MFLRSPDDLCTLVELHTPFEKEPSQTSKESVKIL